MFRLMFRTDSLRLKPTGRQARELNAALQERREAWKTQRKRAYVWSIVVLQLVNVPLDAAYLAFGKYPRVKTKGADMIGLIANMTFALWGFWLLLRT